MKPSAAGSNVMGGKAVNGWRFWSVEGAAPAKAEKPEKQAKARTPGGSRGPRKATKSSATKKAKTTATLFRMKDQENVPEGQTLWFCRGCMDGFLVEGEDEPTACPQGHTNDDPEQNAPSGSPRLRSPPSASSWTAPRPEPFGALSRRRG